jgi:hypothetical protein
MRMHMRRFARLTNAFSKKIENHACAVALHSMYYNFVRLHQTLKVSPAMAAGVTDRLWEMTDVVDMFDAFEAKRKREPKARFDIEEWRIGGGFYVRATWEDGTSERVETDTFLAVGDAPRAGLRMRPVLGCTLGTACCFLASLNNSDIIKIEQPES